MGRAWGNRTMLLHFGNQINGSCEDGISFAARMMKRTKPCDDTDPGIGSVVTWEGWLKRTV